jgi:transmembrane 9 superfamily protein 2/4
MIVLFLTGMVAMIMMRTLHADLRRYNSMDANEEAEETGWKLVHGDVFRPPTRPMLLSVLVGSGVQVFTMTLITLSKFFVSCAQFLLLPQIDRTCMILLIAFSIAFAVLGFLSPANRGGLANAMVVLFVVMG